MYVYIYGGVYGNAKAKMLRYNSSCFGLMLFVRLVGWLTGFFFYLFLYIMILFLYIRDVIVVCSMDLLDDRKYKITSAP